MNNSQILAKKWVNSIYLCFYYTMYYIFMYI